MAFVRKRVLALAALACLALLGLVNNAALAGGRASGRRPTAYLPSAGERLLCVDGKSVGKLITLRHLLSHTAGLRDATAGTAGQSYRAGRRSVDCGSAGPSGERSADTEVSPTPESALVVETTTIFFTL